MTEYLHHVPGRLRIRSKLFRSNTPERGTTLRQFRKLDGVLTTRLNHKSGSVVVCYEPSQIGPQEIMKKFDDCCEGLELTAKKPKKKISNQPPVAWDHISKEVKKVAINMLISRGVGHSISAILGK